MNEERKTLAIMEFLYKYRAITKEQLMNIFYSDWTVAYRTLTGVSKDSCIHRKMEIAFNSFPTVMNYIESNKYSTVIDIVEHIYQIRNDIDETYNKDKQSLPTTYCKE